MSSVTYPSGHVITMSRDSMGRVAGITYKPTSTTASQTLASNVYYKSFSPLYLAFAYGNGLVRTLTYDQDYRITNIATPGVQGLSIAYDNADNVTSINDSLDSTRNQSFTYDANYRMLTASGKYGSLAYTYNPIGNRKTKTEGSVVKTYNYQGQDGQHYNTLANMTDNNGNIIRTFTFNKGGDTTSDTATASSFSWSNRNRMAQAVGVGGTGVYKYNAFGQRAQKTVGTSSLAFVYIAAAG